MEEKRMLKIVRKMVNGDKKAFDMVFLHYYKKIYFYCINHFYSKEDTEELVQEIFVKLWLNRSSIDLKKNFESYLFTIAKNHIINDLRKKVNNKASIEAYHNRIKNSENLVEQEILYNELESQVYNAIKSLPEKRQEIFILSKIEGLTYKEIAAKLNISVKTVETHMKLALDYFKKVFASRIVKVIALLLLALMK